MDQRITLYEDWARPGDIGLDGDPAPPKKGHSSPTLNIRLMSIVATAGWIKM